MKQVRSETRGTTANRNRQEQVQRGAGDKGPQGPSIEEGKYTQTDCAQDEGTERTTLAAICHSQCEKHCAMWHFHAVQLGLMLRPRLGLRLECAGHACNFTTHWK